MTQVGNYANPPARRMAFDSDGTSVLLIDQTGQNIQLANLSNMQSFNDEGASTYWSVTPSTGQNNLVFVFPEVRDVTNFFAAAAMSAGGVNGAITSGPIYVSYDTTNGADGTWTQIAASYTLQTSSYANSITTPPAAGAPNFRSLLQSINSAVAVKAIKFQFNVNLTASNILIYSWHVWGIRSSSGQYPHRIDFCDNNGFELRNDFDYGEISRGNSGTWVTNNNYNQSSGLYIVNRSTQKTANSVTLSFEGLTGTMNTELNFSLDNTNFSTTLNYTAMVPGAMNGPIFIRYQSQSNDTLSLAAARIKIAVGSWT